MKKEIVLVLLLGALFGTDVAAQTPQDDRRLIPPRTIQLTAQQDHVIKENVKDMHVEPIHPPKQVRIGDKLSPDTALHDFPALVIEKVPKVKAYKFFVTEKRIILVGPNNEVADIIR